MRRLILALALLAPLPASASMIRDGVEYVDVYWGTPPAGFTLATAAQVQSLYDRTLHGDDLDPLLRDSTDSGIDFSARSFDLRYDGGYFGYRVTGYSDYSTIPGETENPRHIEGRYRSLHATPGYIHVWSTGDLYSRVVPEPASAALLGMGLLILARARRS